MYYEVHGEGEPLLLIAGLMSDSSSWQPVIEALSENHKVIIFDNRGVGRSKPADIKTSVELMAEDAIKLLKKLRIKSASILGHSMGGFVAQQIALEKPEVVDKLILVSSSTKANSLCTEKLAKLAQERVSDTDIRIWLEEVFSCIFTKQLMSNPVMVNGMIDFVENYEFLQTPISFENQVNAIKEFDSSEMVSKIDKPTLLIYGAEDELFPVEESISALNQIEGVEPIIIDGAAHSVYSEKPDEFVGSVLWFLE